jgi:hypothetical protein
MVKNMTQSNNPLRKHFRQAAIHLKLPSAGKFYPPGSIIMPANNELPILPMTAMDEITGRTPDALFNGAAVAELVQSCVPNIINAWVAPVIDFNALLVAIRLASYGHDMEIGTTCPKCGAAHQLNVDLRIVLDNLKSPDYEKSITDGDLTFYFAPMNYKQVNDNSRISFEDQKIIQQLSSIEMDETEKITKLGQAFRRITEATIRSIAQSINAIKTAEAMVTDTTHIQEFLHNCTKNTFEAIKTHAISLRAATELPPIPVTCDACQHEYKQEFTLDMSNFFETAS